MLNQGNISAGTTSPLMPAPGTPVEGAQAPANANIIATVLLIDRVAIIESTAIMQTREPLNNSNWSI